MAPYLLRRLSAALLALALLGCGGRDLTPEPGPECSTAADCATPPPTDPRPEGSLRIAAFNVHRLFDTVCDSGACGGSNYEELPSPSAFQTQVNELAEAIALLDADVVLLGEIETQASLDALRTSLQTLRPGFRHAVLGETGAPASVDVAVLSTFPIIQVRRHRDRPLTRPDGSTTRFSRELLEVHLDASGSEVIVFSAHFRSKVDDDPGRRFAEAEASRDIVSGAAAASPRALVVLGGDLNDVPGSAPLQALEQGGALHRVSSDRPAEETWTYSFFGDREAIDHLYLARGGGTYVPGSFRAAREGERGYGGSDHAAVYADFLPAR